MTAFNDNKNHFHTYNKPSNPSYNNHNSFTNMNVPYKPLNIWYKDGLILMDKVINKIVNNIYFKKIITGHEKYLAIPAYKYRYLKVLLKRENIPHEDKVAKFEPLNRQITIDNAHIFQKEAVDKWFQHKRGIIELPTGAGKTFTATYIINVIQRPSLIVVPTIDLMRQWQKYLAERFKIEIGMIGGGTNDIKPITLVTYKSLVLCQKELADKFCLLIFDEVHHATSKFVKKAIKTFIAPYRLGLTATMPEEDNLLKTLKDIVGSVCYTKETEQLTGKYLSNFTKNLIYVELNEEEREDYKYNHEIYKTYHDKQKSLTKDFNWVKFASQASKTEEGRLAMSALRRKRTIAFDANSKYDYLSDLFANNINEKILIFTDDNFSASCICKLLNIPIIIHKTKKKDRINILNDFRNGTIKHLVSSRVLNEGIDVPDVKIAVVFSGSGTTREHKQRLGRILRKTTAPNAQFIELVSLDTSEEKTSERRNKKKSNQDNKFVPKENDYLHDYVFYFLKDEEDNYNEVLEFNKNLTHHVNQNNTEILPSNQTTNSQNL